ncbi:MAG: ABC transporter substrate-binding protein, partial [Brevibacterium sp.]|nr:ABC transporter substrate-binding protein [Brevibacterium sp.]
EKELVSDISDVWANVEGMPESMKNASSTTDGRQIFMPMTYYPWAVFYRPSLFAERGYSEPKTFDEWMALNQQMASDGLIPMAFAAKDGWEPMGTFDMLNLRINGYDYHISLLAGNEAWDGDRVKKGFEVWAQMLPYAQEAALGRTWQEAAQSLLQKQSGTFLLGMFLQQQFAASEEAKDDLDFFIFPEIDPAIGADVVEAPIDGFMMAADPRNLQGSRDLMLYLSTPEAADIIVAADPSRIAASSLADQSNYSALQKKAVKVIEEAKNISQFLDRDSRPDFASTVIGPALQAFIRDPGNIDSILDTVEKQKHFLFTS